MVKIVFIDVKILVHHGSLDMVVVIRAYVTDSIQLAAIMLTVSVTAQVAGMVLYVQMCVHLALMVHTAI